jgi:hypothetical protein
MEARELRIGNYLIIDGILVRVRSVYSFTNGSFKNNEGTVEAYRYDSIFEPKKISAGINRFEPIPLTEEWLVKFGFIKGEDSYSFRGFFLENRNTDPFLPQLKREKLKDSFGVWRNNNFLTNIKHVHQLENLYFALTNQELTIKN